MSWSDQIAFARHATRLKWGRATAWRTGFMVGRLGLTASNPYPAFKRGFHCFEEGIRFGLAERLRGAEAQRDG